MAEAVSPQLPAVAPHQSTEARQAPTPPTSEEWNKHDDNTSELSDLEDEDDIGEIEPDHYYEGGKVPVFKPVSTQLCDEVKSRACCTLLLTSIFLDNGAVPRLQKVH